MKKISLILFGIFLILKVSCFARPIGNITGKNYCSQTEKTTESTVFDFQKFLEIYSSDSIFQLNHVVFPLKYISVDIEDNEEIKMIKKEEWKSLHFKSELETQDREIDGYKQLIEIESDTAKVLIRGIDNGIYIDFIFEKRNKSWFLIEWGDYSN
ncbi:DUF4348 domain-containing protein [Plebeiibacterium marinum]|uniref:DUF4348 domain-containing protein n=1 Tax=Plebeiibacterium marinum TaxID=2992111 RepID=A0AAE3SLN4_9BACT|nr:DUF4348 domain-containing protein [Plebeiobacterium marinum]MCW3808070.1 DUF4348 domain-containing protein [Plebeiobacterium marinum]